MTQHITKLDESEQEMFAQFGATVHALTMGDNMNPTDQDALLWGLRELKKIYELGDGEPSPPPPKVGGVYTGLRGGCESDPSGLHECGVEENHKLCVCADCGANWPNPEWHGAAKEVSPVGSVQKITGPERPRCPVCGAETTCLSCGTKTGGDTRELKAALRKLANEAKGFVAMADFVRHGNTNIAVIKQRIAEAEKLLG